MSDIGIFSLPNIGIDPKIPHIGWALKQRCNKIMLTSSITIFTLLYYNMFCIFSIYFFHIFICRWSVKLWSLGAVWSHSSLWTSWFIECSCVCLLPFCFASMLLACHIVCAHVLVCVVVWEAALTIPLVSPLLAGRKWDYIIKSFINGKRQQGFFLVLPLDY